MEYPFDKVTIADVLMQLNPKTYDSIVIYRIVDGIPVFKLSDTYVHFINDPVGLYLPAFVKDFVVEKKPDGNDDADHPGNNIINFYI